jgi:hypothetical protein
VIDIGGRAATVYPGTYEEWLWSKRQRSKPDTRGPIADASKPKAPAKAAPGSRPGAPDPGHRTSDTGPKPPQSFEQKKRADAEARKARKDAEARQRRVTDLEGRIAAAETEITELEARMSAAGFYENHEVAKPIIDRHQALMWEVGDLMNKWEVLQTETEV